MNGINYRILAKRRLVIPNSKPSIVKMIIHEEIDGSARLEVVSGLLL